MKTDSVEKYLQLEEDLRRYRNALNQAMEIVINENVSNYPIFIFHQQELDMGVPVIIAGESTGSWSVHVSSLEEFHVKNIIPKEKLEDFQKVYKEHDHHLCLFVLSELGAQFIFYSRSEEIYTPYGSLN